MRRAISHLDGSGSIHFAVVAVDRSAAAECHQLELPFLRPAQSGSPCRLQYSDACRKLPTRSKSSARIHFEEMIVAANLDRAVAAVAHHHLRRGTSGVQFQLIVIEQIFTRMHIFDVKPVSY